MRSSIITFTTDFGTYDSYVAQMKGVVLSIAPEARLIDINHEVPKFDIEAGAAILREAVPMFPEHSVHVGVVDPGVGSARRRIVIEAKVDAAGLERPKRMLFVGPDNGLFALVAPIEAIVDCWEIVNIERLPTAQRSLTFDGRDVFSPVAALLAKGATPADFGQRIDRREAPLAPLRSRYNLGEREGVVYGQIVRFDSFGNAATNIPLEMVNAGEATLITDSDQPLTLPFAKSFSKIPKGQAQFLINSQGFLELAANEQSVKELLSLRLGMVVRIKSAAGQ